MADKKHILFISSWYPNRNDPTLGIFNKYFAQAASLYNTVSILNVSSETDLNERIEITKEMHDNILMVSVYYRKISSAGPFSQLRKRNRVLTAFEKGYEQVVKTTGRPDVIHLNVVLPMGVAALHLSEKHKIPLVINENWSGYTSEDGNYKGVLKKMLTRRIVSHARAIMPTSTYLRDAMLSHDLKGEYTVIPNVVNVHLFKPAEVQRRAGTRLIHISSLNDREKNVSGLIRAFAAAAKKQNDLHLSIVGEGVDKEQYLRLVQELGMTSHIGFKGRLFGDQLVKEINASDALIMFSNFETFCLVIIEAFACGKPVITSDAGAIKTYMRPELGIMVDKGSEEQLASAIIRFCDTRNIYNREEIRKYAVENYSYEVVGQRLSEIYNSAIKN